MYRGRTIVNVARCAQKCMTLNCTVIRDRRLDFGHFTRINVVQRYAKQYKRNFDDQKHEYEGKTFLLYGGIFSTLFDFFKSEGELESEIVMSIKRSILLIQKGEFKKAENLLHIALRQAQLLQNENAITYIYDVMANLAFDTDDFQKAHKLFVSVLQRQISAGTSENDMKVIHISLKVAKSLEYMGDIKMAEQGYMFCLKELEDRITMDPEDNDVLLLLAMSLHWYASMLFSQARYTEASQYFSKAYDYCVRVNGKEHEQNVILLNDLGTVNCMLGEYDKAISYLSTAMEIGKQFPDMEKLASVYVNLGNVLIKKGLYDEAKRLCKEGWQLSKKKEDDESKTEAENCLEEIKKLML